MRTKTEEIASSKVAQGEMEIGKTEIRRRAPDYTIGLFLAALILLSATISGFVLFKQSLRLDESQSLWQTTRSPAAMLTLVAEDVHVPLYHLLLHYWRIFVGDGVPEARAMSLLFFLLTIPAVYFLGKIAYNKSAGIFAALLLSISPFLNWYASEIRMYTLMTLFAVVNQYFFIRLYKKNEGWVWFLYAATALLGAYTHYFFTFILLGQAVFYLFNRKLFPRGSFFRFVAVAVLVLAAYAPWVLFVRHLGMLSNSTPTLPQPTSISIFNTFSQFLFGFQDDHINTLIVSLWPLVVLLGFLALQRHKKVTPETMYFLLSATLPLLAAFGISFVYRPLYLARYLILALPSLYLVIIWLISTYQSLAQTALRTILVAGMAGMFVVQTVSAATPVKENYREAVSYLEQKATAEDVILVSAPFTIYPVEYYYNGPASIATVPDWNRYVVGPIPSYDQGSFVSQVNDIKTDHDIAWVLLSYDQGYQTDIKNYFDSHFQQVDEEHFSPGLDLYAYKIRYNLPNTNLILQSLNNNGATSTSTILSASKSPEVKAK